MGRDDGASIGDNADIGVSIHAPAWGATLTNSPKKTKEEVSIHAPAWGATGS